MMCSGILSAIERRTCASRRPWSLFATFRRIALNHLVMRWMVVAAALLVCHPGYTDDPSDGSADRQPEHRPGKDFSAPEGARRLAPDAHAWVDPKHGTVIIDGEVCLREGPLEMFACTRGTKEYESVVTLDVKARLVHAALLVLGADPGGPVQFQPKYVPASGTPIDVRVSWYDASGKLQSAPAQHWVRNVRTKEPLTHDWVFAGSGFWQDPKTGIEYYQAEGGDFICVSNFPSAMLDLPIESTQANEGLLFEAFTEHVPALGTPVRVTLHPRLERPPD